MAITIVKSYGAPDEHHNSLALQQSGMVLTVKAGTVVCNRKAYVLAEDSVTTVPASTSEMLVRGYLVQKKDDKSVSVLVDEVASGDPSYDFRVSPYSLLLLLYMAKVPLNTTSLDQVNITSYQIVAPGE